jgi:geranylgeranyl diphosphate synthase type II
VDAIPPCAGAASLRALAKAESERLVPQATVRDLALAA